VYNTMTHLVEFVKCSTKFTFHLVFSQVKHYYVDFPSYLTTAAVQLMQFGLFNDTAVL